MGRRQDTTITIYLH